MIKAFTKLVQDNQKPNMVVAELGIWCGDTLFSYADTVKANNGKIYAIDTFAGNPGAVGVHAYNESGVSKIEENVRREIKERGLDKTIVLIKGKTAEVSAQIPHNSVHLLLVDADHRYTAVKKDIELYLGKMVKGGLFCLHDCENTWMANTFTPEQLEQDFLSSRQAHCGVIQAVYDHFGKNVEIRPSEGVAPIAIYKVQQKYRDELIKAMNWLGEKDNFIALGQAVEFEGTGMHSTLKGIPSNKKLEVPVFENTQMGLSTGLALNGYTVLSIYPRWNFLICATDQLLGHLNNLFPYTDYHPRLIIRTAIGSKVPLDPQNQHHGDYTEQFQKLCPNLNIQRLDKPEDIFPAYEKAYRGLDKKVSLLVEVADYYNFK